MNYQFEPNELPYGILEHYGLTQEMVEDLPLDVLQKIYKGQRSPVLPVRFQAEDGEVVSDRTQFSLVRMEDGKVDVLFYPVFEETNLSLFDETQRQRLEANRPIIGYRNEGETEAERGPKCFIQLDPENKHVLSVPTSVIGRAVTSSTSWTGSILQALRYRRCRTVKSSPLPTVINSYPLA